MRPASENGVCRIEGLLKRLVAVRTIVATLLFAVLMLPAQAQQAADPGGMSARLSAQKVGDIETGSYSAGDKQGFTLEPYGDKYLLRFAAAPESYVLSVERVMLGGRILRYDTGAVALRVSVWGGMTLYTADAPGGLPATRLGNDPGGLRAPASREDLVAAMADEESHLAYTQQLHLRFAADPSVLSGSDVGLAFDALVSAAAGIERLTATPGGRQALTRKFNTVRLVESDKPGVMVSGKILVVGFAPGAGAAGRASSREVALQLGKMLQIAEAG
jgi:Domain of unknown function (DUF4908)